MSFYGCICFLFTSKDVNSVVGTPGFTNASTFNFTLVSEAFATDKGDPTYNATYSGTLDFDDDIRKRNGRIDIGCSELQTGSTAKKAATAEVTDEIAPSFAVFPNPASDKININFGKEIQLATISVLDLNGQTLFKGQYSATNSATINVSDLGKSQLVILQINADNEISNNKIYLK
ncbi:T9SS type A sorting domain-containing protein [Flavobacterium sp. LBUM151]